MKLAVCIEFSLMTVDILGAGLLYVCVAFILLAVQDNGKMNT